MIKILQNAFLAQITTKRSTRQYRIVKNFGNKKLW